jgi:tRNA modification GTPase
MLRINDTICAPATSGKGAIAVIRLSGADCLSICEKVFFPANLSSKISEQKGYTILYGEIRYENEVIDDVLVSIFKAPYSYTGENSAEISCHGSPYIQQKIIELLINNGASIASPGEFTQRAFLNGKMDLSQAEAVADLIASESKMAHKIAINQMRGAFSDEISILRAELLHFASLIELELDFGEEDVLFADRTELKEIVSRVILIACNLASSFSVGNIIKNGVPVAIVGNPNTGKSTLLNALLKEEKAIVSEIPGTTRDVIEDTIIIEGIQFRFIDTAGLRDTKDIIENLGIKKTYEKIDLASVILIITDINEGIPAISGIVNDIRRHISGKDKNVVLLVNKIDTDLAEKQFEIRNKIILQDNEDLLFISAKNGTGLGELKNHLGKVIEKKNLSSENVIVTNVRHYEALKRVTESLERVEDGLNSGLPSDLVAVDIRHAIHFLGEISGEITSDEILGNIFKNFCIGK